MRQSGITEFNLIINKFYNRIEKDEKFFNYYNVDVSEAILIAQQRAKNYLIESLEKLSQVGNLQVDFSDYDSELDNINFETTAKENRLIVDLMFQEYMEKDISLLHAFEINFTPSDLKIITPSTERKTYMDLVNSLHAKNEIEIDNYKNRDRITGKLISPIDYTLYGDDY